MASGLVDKLNKLAVQVVLISGYALPVPPEKVAAVLQKPMVEEELLAALRTMP